MSTSNNASAVKASRVRRGVQLTLIVVCLVVAATFVQWYPTLDQAISRVISSRRPQASALDSHSEDHGGHDHAGGKHTDSEHAGHDHSAADAGLELSAQARKNLGLTSDYIDMVRLTNFRRFVTVPAIIAARPGRTQVHVATPLNGVITHVHAVTGESVMPGTLLFEIRLTHEDLVQSQTDFLKSLGELDVEMTEMQRLRAAAQSGALSEKTLLDRQYAIDKLQSLLTAQREALHLHGLSDRQVSEIETSRRLLRELRVFAPMIDEHDHGDELKLADDSMIPVAISKQPATRADRLRDEQEERLDKENQALDQSLEATMVPLVIEQLNVHKGQAVAAGDMLCTVADYSRLYIQGDAFEQDIHWLSDARKNGWPLMAVFDAGQGKQELNNLNLSYIGNVVDTQNRTLPFYVDLKNEILEDQFNDEHQRFVVWKYRPGQRLQLRVPMEEWVDQIVLPVDAVARDGAEAFVFRQYGGHFDRVPVHVVYSDQRSVVIAADGELKPGAVVALKSAHQMQIAMKIQAGGGADPHAGHNH
ncbi:MAG: efflux RND transporter periplasmic adaptor subunit [Planctomycetaceae bacterium]